MAVDLFEQAGISMPKAEKLSAVNTQATQNIDQVINTAILDASTQFNIDPAYLFGTAEIESNFNPSASSPHSSAKGLFQITNGTGQSLGLDDSSVFNPKSNALAAAKLAKQNKAGLKQSLLNRGLSDDEATQLSNDRGALYLAHQQGQTGAANLISGQKVNEQAIRNNYHEKILPESLDFYLQNPKKFAQDWMNHANSVMANYDAPIPDQSAGSQPVDLFEQAGIQVDQPTQQEIEQLPEFGTVAGNRVLFGNALGLRDGNDVFKQLSDAAAGLITFNPKARIDQIKKRFPGLEVTPIQDGDNALIKNPETGEIAVLNASGLSNADIAPFVGSAIAFTPAGRAASMAKTGVGGFVTAAGLSAGTDALIQGSEQALGSDQDFDPVRSAITGVAGGAGEAVGRKIVQRFSGNAAQAPAVRESQQLSDEFNVPLTRGEQTGNPNIIANEQALQRGVNGAIGQNSIHRQLDQRSTQLTNAVENTQQNVTGSNIQNTAEAGEVITRGLNELKELENLKVKQAFEGLLDADLVFREQAFKNISDRFAAVLNDNAYSLNSLPGQASRNILSELDEFSKLPGDKAFKETELFRRKIGRIVGTADNAEDLRAATLLRKEYDQFIDDAMVQGLAAGDQSVIDAIKNARGLRAEFARKFQNAGAKTLDERAGKIVESLTDINADPSQAVNLIFGASVTGAKRESIATIRRLNKIFGNDSPEMAALRGAAFIRLMKNVSKQGTEAQGITKVQINRNFSAAFSDKNKGVYEALFNKDQLAKMKRLGRLIIKTQPDLVNPSGTASEFMRQVFNRLGTVQAGAGGVLSASVLGFDPVTAGLIGVGLFGSRQLTGINRARRAFKPVKPRDFNPERVNLVPAGAVTGEQINLHRGAN